jgi:hypothetical protein
MKRLLLMATIFVLGFTLTLAAQDKKEFKYVGVKKCKTCHSTSKIGKQYQIWKENAHANALESLGSEESIAYAKENDLGDPTKAPECLNCHATAATVDKALLTETITIEEGVSCESCHGPGSEYKAMKIMKSHELSLQNGLIVPEEKVCLTCHNEKNPFHKPLDYEAGVKQISHPVPEKE